MLSLLPWLEQAVQQNGQSLQHASDELQLDPELQEVVGSLKIRCPGKLLGPRWWFQIFVYFHPELWGRFPY